MSESSNVTSVAASLPHPRDLTFTDVLLGGEAVPDAEKDRWAPAVGVHNGYGPTETTIISVTAALGDGDRVRLGRPPVGATLSFLPLRLRS